MKRFFLFFVFFIFFNTHSFAQKKIPHPFRFEFSIGPSYFLNNIQSTNFFLKKHGYNVNIKFKYKLTKNTGILLMYATNYNKFYSKFTADISAFSIAFGNFNSYNLMAGGFYEFNIRNKLSLESKFLAGYSTIKHKHYMLFILPLPLPDNYNNKSSSFSLYTGTGIYYKVKENFSLGFNIDYHFSTLEFDNNTTNNNNNTDLFEYPDTYNVFIFTVNFQFIF